MEERIRIAIPDSIELDFVPAGIGSRFLAVFIDGAIQLLANIVLIAVLYLTMGKSYTALFENAGTWEAAFYIIVFFLIRWGYNILFEMIWHGQTPGKRIIGIRVVRSNGLPIDFSQSLIRNFVRIIDMLPPPLYLTGGISALVTRNGQRLGDLAAGTLVIRDRFFQNAGNKLNIGYSAGWVTKLEQGMSSNVVVLPKGTINIRQIALIEEYLARTADLSRDRRDTIAWQIARPLLPLFDILPEDWESAPDRSVRCERLFREILERSRQSIENTVRKDQDENEAVRKAHTWENFQSRVSMLGRQGTRGLKAMSAGEMKSLLVDYRRITTDLARAQSMNADDKTLAKLTGMVIGGHGLLYGRVKTQSPFPGGNWITMFAREFRASIRAVGLAALVFFCAAFVSGVAVRENPLAAYELVSPAFYDFQPASEENIHDIPGIFRPIAATSIMTNNLQVSILAFAGGLTAGPGTLYLLLVNGVHLGSVIGWLEHTGNGKALWGWIMPHGVTEILAILISAGAGLLLSQAILMPGRRKRGAALREASRRALVLELGCMGMLVIAALIEGFVSPGTLKYPGRIAFMWGSMVFWAVFFLFAGRRERKTPDSSARGKNRNS